MENVFIQATSINTPEKVFHGNAILTYLLLYIKIRHFIIQNGGSTLMIDCHIYNLVHKLAIIINKPWTIHLKSCGMMSSFSVFISSLFVICFVEYFICINKSGQCYYFCQPPPKKSDIREILQGFCNSTHTLFPTPPQKYPCKQ